jgi:UDP-4-amino-4,6-dideoxy-N-acetyl-beta-L-altrosamine transaminase
MKKVIPYGKQHITDEDIQAVVEVLRSDYLTQGPVIESFEKAFAKYVGADFAVAVSNGTAALHLCAMAMDLKPGQKVITTPITFAATANCIQYCGAEVVFSDIDPETYLLDLDKVRALLEASPKGTYAGVIPVDFAGRAVDLEQWRALADEFGLWIIEDSCHAPGGFFLDASGKRQYCGNGQFADCAIFSFHPVKHIAAGEGGMITTNDSEVYKRLCMLRTHGITREVDLFQNQSEVAWGHEDSHRPGYPGWYMEMQELGYNYRLTDFQAALGLSQLGRAGEGLERRRQIAATYATEFDGVKGMVDRNVEAHGALDANGHAHHLYVVEVENRAALYEHLRENGVFAQIHYFPTHLMPYYRKLGWAQGDLPFAENFYRKCISLPLYPTYIEEEQSSVINLILKLIDSK